MDYSRFAHVRLTPFELWVQSEGLQVNTTYTISELSKTCFTDVPAPPLP
jgi:hypothetical protein